jgi:DNA-binding transcriptional LysR family regulator
MAIELRHLRYFVAVAQELHFGRAAELLHIAQPALSQQIQSLERLLDTRLLQRTRRSVSLTDAGRLFLEEARLTLRQAERATTVGRRAGRGELGKVEIGYVASAIFTGLLSTVVLAFQQSHPAVELSFIEMDGVRQITELAEGRLDIAFVRRPIPRPRGIDTVTLLTEPVVVALRADHPLASLKRIPEAALIEETFIIPRINPGISFHEHTMAIGRLGGFVPHIMYHGRDLMSIASVVELGLGIAIVPASLGCVHLPNVVFRPLSSGKERANLSAAFRQPESAPAAQAFIAAIRDTKVVDFVSDSR